ncbi:MAG: hypothetical protein J5636_00810 [Clostridiales bacterium]|nr:hypothetical protein [Clostridiales bacterium]
MKILFSPVGKTDPMSIRRDPETREVLETRDASMMHIYRRYLPDYTYLYMTSEIYEIENNDHRYTGSMRQLAESLGRTFVEGEDYEILRSSVEDQVYDMDAFYDEFYSIIQKIRQEHEYISELLINTSSGTPAMKSALFVLKSMKNTKCKLLQVLDPYPHLKPANIEPYHTDLYFEKNRDNELSKTEGSPCEHYRLRDVSNRNINAMKINGILKELIKAYDYDAAYSVFVALFGDGDENSRELEDLLKFASARRKLRAGKLKDKGKHNYEKLKKTYIPFYDANGDRYICTEYALNLKISFDKKEINDAIRAMTPLDTKLFCLIYEQITGIKVESYMDPQGFFDRQKPFPSLLEIHFKKASLGKNDSRVMVGPSSLNRLIKEATDPQRDRQTIEMVKNITTIEKDTRNLAAHIMMTIPEEEFLKKAQLKSVEQLFNYYEVLIEKAGYSRQVFDWKSYKRMNDDILMKIDEVL